MSYYIQIIYILITPTWLVKNAAVHKFSTRFKFDPKDGILGLLSGAGTMAKERGNFGTRLGFILAAAGSAIGLGNIWKFPYLAGENGGAVFLIIYLGFIFTIGLSVMLAEFAIGRRTKRNPIGAFRHLKGGPWSAVGAMGVFTGFIILSFYSVVGGWTASPTRSNQRRG